MLREMRPVSLPSDVKTISLIMTYELGDFVKCLVKSASYSYDEKLAKAFLTEAKIGLADMLTQARLLCELLGWQFEEVKALGQERYEEAMRQFGEKSRTW